MTPEQKLKVGLAWYHSAFAIKKAAIEKQHPDWDEIQVLRSVKKAFLHAAT
jgi:hypothetical protein